MKKFIQKKLLPLILFSILTLIGMEIWARLDDWIRCDAPLLSEYSEEKMLIVHDSLGVRGKPNGRFEKWSLNSLGFRGPEIKAEKSPHVLRIATMGASETFGIYESVNKEWPRQLAENLKIEFPNQSIEVVNTALPGMTLESALKFYRNRIAFLRPDIVLFYVNVLPFLDWPKALKTKDVSIVTKITSVNKKSRFSFGKPRLITKLNQALHTRGPKKLVDQYEANKVMRRYLGFNRHGQNPELDSSQMKQFKALLHDFIDTLHSDGITLILSEHAHALSVWKGDTHPKGWLNLWQYYPAISEAGLKGSYPQLNSLFREIGAQSGCEVVHQENLLQAPDSNFAADGIHFTDKGATLVAENFLKVLRPILMQR